MKGVTVTRTYFDDKDRILNEVVETLRERKSITRKELRTLIMSKHVDFVSRWKLSNFIENLIRQEIIKEKMPVWFINDNTVYMIPNQDH